MKRNHQDTTGSTRTGVEDGTWVFHEKSQFWVPKHSEPGWLRRGFKDKASWDWIQFLVQLLAALALPVTLFLATQWFSAEQRRASLQIAQEQQQQAILQTYLDDMADLLLNHHLRMSQPGDEVSLLAKERTLTTLRRLDADRNQIVLQFLHDAHLMGMKATVIDLSDANLSNVDLGTTNLSGAHLSRADLRGADLRGADLSYADLSGADLQGADLSRPNPSHGFLPNFSHVDLDKTRLQSARYNTKEILVKDSQGHIIVQFRPTVWPEGFNPKAARTIEDNTAVEIP